jgi:dihydropteroate synthase
VTERAIVTGRHTLRVGTRTLVMGVVNATPDSFSGDGVGGDPEAAVRIALEMVAAGADIIDVGGESTRPNAQPLDAGGELARVLPVITAVAARVPVPVSIDTRHATVAAAAIEAGAAMVNDIWGLRGDPGMASVVAAAGVAVVAMHNQRGTAYGDLMAGVRAALEQSLSVARSAGIDPDRVILDPGFGFGKTPAQNLELIRRLTELIGLGRPLLVGASRKSTIGMVLDGAPPSRRLEGSLALAVLAAAAGADIVRVHDVAETVRALRVADAVTRGTPAAIQALPAPGPTG